MKNHTISHAIQIGCDLPSSMQALDLAKDYPGYFHATVGIHPNEAQKYDFSEIDNVIQKLDEIILNNREYIVGIGETGLDFHYPSENPGLDKERQYYAWKHQAELSQKYNLPLIIHSRDAPEETFSFIQKSRLENLIMHCYSENREFAERLLQYSSGIYFSFSGILTYPKSLAIQDAAKHIPLSQILVETDSPFLSPQVVRGTINEPANVRYVLEKLIDLREEDSGIIEEVVYENSLRVFGLKKYLG